MIREVDTGPAIEPLPQAVADAIAAGEVVERPASVVKELCENAVDAGAGSVDVTIEGAGTIRVAVSDDGRGIAAGEMGLALARHATSKIRAAADLERVATLGFRGEALASIAAVADLTLSSRRREDRVGAVLRVRHGETVEEGAWGGPPGTTVEVLELFAATPARLRFLRSDRAETAAAVTVAAELALAHPRLRVHCRVDGRSRLRTEGSGEEAALRSVFGDDAWGLLRVEQAGDVAVAGALSEPRHHRSTRAGLVLVVNGRRVHNRALMVAVADAYRGLVPQGRYPFGVVRVDLDPADVDVNVHPAKREVRFRDERGVYAIVQRACWHALADATAYRAAAPDLGALGFADAAPQGHAAGPPERRWGQAPGGDAEATVAGQRNPEGDAALVAAPPPSQPYDRGAALADLRPLRALGQQGGRWLAAASPRGVVLVDPHAAHEKVLYSELLAAWSSGETAHQLLLIPVTLDVDGDRMDRFQRHAAAVAAYGFAVEVFGTATLRCTAVPAAASRADPARLVADLIDTLEAAGPASEQRHRAAALVACHAAVRFGDELGASEQQHLLDRLVATPGGITCPHGRPTVVVIEEGTLRRLFRRGSE